MEDVSDDEKVESIRAFQSTIRKLETARAQMTRKGVSLTLIEKRLSALSIGLAILENVWHQKPHPYLQAELSTARQVLDGLLPSIKSSYDKAKAGSPQSTLLKRRIQSLEWAIRAMDEQL
ncbi:hypothetical protein IDH44_00110 [Paenibacillus sp. IB182496]|uniref:Uncharacterized protein n=1 Tax=Paenibacillus sabuli TaxID=2772509 RepID=A0A927BNY5_9BACL|nr:hypothetical protein [Paenibacillus sabuli]MBD2843577.1 hypothetical protein [Paenibacillus sabuli]